MRELINVVGSQQLKLQETKGDVATTLDKLNFTAAQKELINSELAETKDRLTGVKTELENKKQVLVEQSQALKQSEYKIDLLSK